ncbi:MAG: cyclic nucleotide-binding domain-containing protein [Deltaproteobacteria bacterium]|nr:MAG: cyclic nucleotide-binding domain-containing protein [Deltaproteobacteria bacterium]
MAALARTPLAEGLDADELGRLARAGRVEHWPEEAVVMEEGSLGPRLVVVLQGHAEVVKTGPDGTVHVLATVGPGAVLGEMSLLQQAPRSATVRATSAMRVFAMDQATFNGMLEDGDPAAYKLSHRIARVLAARVDELNRRVVDLLARRPSEPEEELARIRSELFTRWDF